MWLPLPCARAALGINFSLSQGEGLGPYDQPETWTQLLFPNPRVASVMLLLSYFLCCMFCVYLWGKHWSLWHIHFSGESASSDVNVEGSRVRMGVSGHLLPVESELFFELYQWEGCLKSIMSWRIPLMLRIKTRNGFSPWWGKWVSVITHPHG